MNLDLSKIQSLIVTPMGSGMQVLVTYKSTRKRGYTFSSEEAIGLGVLLVEARKAGIPVTGLCDSCGVAFPTTSILYVDTPLAVCDACAASIKVPEPAQPAPEPELADVTSPRALVEMLALTPDQASHLTGASRLNFWTRSNLWVQIEHGSRAVKLPLPNAVVTEQQLSRFFAGWGWQQLGTKPYFKPVHDSLVRL